MMAHRFTYGETGLFLRECKKEPCLWNRGLPDYPNNAEREQASRRIAEKLNKPNFGPKEVLKKFAILRQTYNKELQMIATSIRLKKEQVYRPRWAWFSLMDSFMRPFISEQLRQRIGDHPSTTDEPDEGDPIFLDEDSTSE